MKADWRAGIDAVVLRWRGLAPRERLVVAGAAAAFALILYALLWLPMARELDRLRRAVPHERAQLARMQAEAREVDQLRASGHAISASGNVLVIIEQSAGARGLRPQITRMDPDGSNGARLALDGIGFDSLAGWLADLQAHSGVRVEKAAIEARHAPGLVSARLVLRGGGGG